MHRNNPCWHDKAITSASDTTTQTTRYCPDCGLSETTFPPLAAQPTTPASGPVAQGESDKHEKEMLELIAQRDHREEIIDALCDAVLGEDRTEWSSAYYFEDAVTEVQDRMGELETRAGCRESNMAVGAGGADWGLDISTGTPILVYKKCSVIESEQARYVLRLIAAGTGGAGK